MSKKKEASIEFVKTNKEKISVETERMPYKPYTPLIWWGYRLEGAPKIKVQKFTTMEAINETEKDPRVTRIFEPVKAFRRAEAQRYFIAIEEQEKQTKDESAKQSEPESILSRFKKLMS